MGIVTPMMIVLTFLTEINCTRPILKRSAEPRGDVIQLIEGTEVSAVRIDNMDVAQSKNCLEVRQSCKGLTLGA